MKAWKVCTAVALAIVAVLLMTSLVVAAPTSTGSVQVDRVYDDPDPILSDTLPTTHPVGIMIALYFNIPYTQVMALHDEGFGFGTIARVYLTAAASDGELTPEQLLEMRQAGVGWGQIKQEYGIHPGGNGLGSIKGNKSQPEPDTSAPEVKPGNNKAPGQQKPPQVKPTKAPKK